MPKPRIGRADYDWEACAGCASSDHNGGKCLGDGIDEELDYRGYIVCNSFIAVQEQEATDD
jgi:hypothetical protein